MDQVKDNASFKLKVSIYNFEKGLETFENVAAVRVINGTHRFLFMSDYTPTLGEINGTIIIIQNDNEIKYENIKGFFVLKDNLLRVIQDDLIQTKENKNPEEMDHEVSK